MIPEVSLYLVKAQNLLDEADKMLSVDLFNAAGRNAYLAGFHAAQGLIASRSGKVAKTHTGVQALFQQLTRNDPAFPPEIRTFLAKVYNLKSVADYETGPGSEIPAARAIEPVAAAHRFVACLAGCLTR